MVAGVPPVHRLLRVGFAVQGDASRDWVANGYERKGLHASFLNQELSFLANI